MVKCFLGFYLGFRVYGLRFFFFFFVFFRFRVYRFLGVRVKNLGFCRVSNGFRVNFSF